MAAEILDHGTRVLTGPGAGFGSDALLLARFARPRVGAAALDLCSGCGIVALCWHDEGHRGPCAAVELGRRGVGAVARRPWPKTGPPPRTSRRSAPTCAPSARRGRSAAGSTLRPATRRISAAARPARTPAAPPPAMKGPARWMTWPPARRGRCGLAGGLRCATAPADLARVCAGAVRSGAGTQAAGLCAQPPRTPRRGCFCWRRAAAGRPGLVLEPDVLLTAGGALVRRGAPNKCADGPAQKNMPNRRRGIDADPILWYNPYG